MIAIGIDRHPSALMLETGLRTVLILCAYAVIIGLLHISGFDLLYNELLAIMMILALPLLYSLNTGALPDYLRIVCRLLAAIVFVYTLLQFPEYPINNAPRLVPEYFPAVMWALTLAVCIASLHKPQLLLFGGFYLPWIKSNAALSTGLAYYNTLDIIPVYQFSLLCALIVLGSYLSLGKIRTVLFKPVALENREQIQQRVCHIAFFVAVSFHLAIYLFSGLEKATLDGGFLSWPLENNLVNIHFVGLNNQQLFWQNIPGVQEVVSFVIQHVARILAIVFFTAQLLAFSAFASRKWLITLLLAYDALHLGIFFVMGANFVTWFLVNTALIAVVWRMPASLFGWRPVLASAVLIVFCQFGFSKFYRVPNLGWYDSLGVNTAYFVADTEDGQEVRLPPAWFLFYSYPVGHMSYGFPPGRYIPTTTNGGTDYIDIKLKADNCAFSEQELSSPFANRWDEQGLREFIRGYHKDRLDKPDWMHKLLMYTYWHHFWPPYQTYFDIDDLDINSIRQYRLIINATCIRPNGRSFDVDILNTEEYTIPL